MADKPVEPRKPRWSLIEPLMPEIEQVVMLLTDACKDHDDFGWMEEPVESDYDAVMRHVSKLGMYDESGYLHEAHAIARLLFRLYKIRRVVDDDMRRMEFLDSVMRGKPCQP